MNDGFGAYIEYFHYLMKIQVPKSLHGSVDTPKVDQFFKSKLYVALINTESKYRYRQHEKTDPNPEFTYPEAQDRHVEELHIKIQITSENRELANHTSVGRPHAILSSTEKTRASQPRNTIESDGQPF